MPRTKYRMTWVGMPTRPVNSCDLDPVIAAHGTERAGAAAVRRLATGAEKSTRRCRFLRRHEAGGVEPRRRLRQGVALPPTFIGGNGTKFESGRATGDGRYATGAECQSTIPDLVVRFPNAAVGPAHRAASVGEDQRPFPRWSAPTSRLRVSAPPGSDGGGRRALGHARLCRSPRRSSSR